MRLFLSSSLFGDHGDTLVRMAGQGARAAIIPNALDNFPTFKCDYLRDTVVPLFEAHGFGAEEVSLATYFASQDALAAELRRFALVWAIGGNAFLLRRAMMLSGFDEALGALLADSPLVYGGWSAGSVVAGRDLFGMDRIDDASATAAGYPPGEPLWEGLGLIDGTVVPHVRSAHPESSAATATVPFIEASGRHAIPLMDGEVLVQDGGPAEILPRTS